jgi:hypothetical protein
MRITKSSRAERVLADSAAVSCTSLRSTLTSRSRATILSKDLCLGLRIVVTQTVHIRHNYEKGKIILLVASQEK